MFGENNQNVYLIQKNASSFAEFEISEFESRLYLFVAALQQSQFHLLHKNAPKLIAGPRTMLWYVFNKLNLESVEHRYLEKGHTQNEGDSIHAAVENASRNISIYTTVQWASVVRTA